MNSSDQTSPAATPADSGKHGFTIDVRAVAAGTFIGLAISISAITAAVHLLERLGIHL